MTANEENLISPIENEPFSVLICPLFYQLDMPEGRKQAESEESISPCCESYSRCGSMIPSLAIRKAVCNDNSNRFRKRHTEGVR
jgi:hypothetical protein